MTTKTWQFKKDEIFTKTDENGNTTMKIPPEVLKVNIDPIDNPLAKAAFLPNSTYSS